MEGERTLKITELRSVKVGVERVAESDKQPFRLTIHDPHTREVLWIGFGQEVADAIMAQLTGGIHVVRQ